MKARALAEAVILQSMEDLWDARHREASLSFFSSQDFRVCATIAGMATDDKIRLLNFVKKISKLPVQSLSKRPDIKNFKFDLQSVNF